MKKAPDTEYLFERLISEDGRIEMGIHPVIFGYRVRAGYVGELSYHLDWCGGGDQGQVEILYSAMKQILTGRTEFSGIPPYSKIKPFFNDLEFVNKIGELAGNFKVSALAPLWVYREQMLKTLFQS